MSDQDDSATPHAFEDCPTEDCDGDLEYPTQGEAMCSDCDGIFIHEIRGNRHLLWLFTYDDGMTEVVARADA